MRRKLHIGAGAALALGLVAGGIEAQPGDGIRANNWVVSPFAELNGVYDSNINQTPSKPVDDTFLDSTIGLRTGLTTYRLDFSGMGFLSRRAYGDANDKDFGAGGEILKLKYGNRDELLLEAEQSFRRVEDLDRYGSEAAVGGVSPDSVLDVSTRERRDVSQAGFSLGKNLTDKTDVDVGYRFDSVNYETRDLLDLVNHIGQAEASHKLTDKTAALVTLKAGTQDNGETADLADYYAARLGLKSQGTDKLSFKAGAGAQQFNRPEDAGDETRFNYDATALWTATDKLTFQAGGRNGSTLSSLYARNGADYATCWIGGSYSVTRTLALSLTGSYREDKYFDPIQDNGAAKDRVDKGKAIRARADYLTPAKFLRVYAESTYESVDSTIEDYDETRVSLGVNFQY
jgi:hypothetical protein